MTNPSSQAAELLRAAERFTDLAQRAREPGARVQATPSWTVADLVAHVAIECDRYARELEGRGDWSASAADIPATNASALAALDTRDIPILNERIRTRVADYVNALASRHPDERSHGLDGNLLLTPRQAAGVLLGELAIHGRDLARATGQRAPIARTTAAHILEGVFAVLPVMVDHDAAARVTLTAEIRVRGLSRRRLHVEHGALEIDGPERRPDVVISASPVSFLLASYGRISPLEAFARGTVPFGRRPHRAFALQRLFHTI